MIFIKKIKLENIRADLLQIYNKVEGICCIKCYNKIIFMIKA